MSSDISCDVQGERRSEGDEEELMTQERNEKGKETEEEEDMTRMKRI